MKSLELKIPPVPLVAVFAAAMYGLSLLVPQVTSLIPGRAFLALGLALLGVVVALAGVITFRANKTTVNPLTPSASSTVVSSGVYRFSRNPMYLGLLLILAAWAIYLSNAIATLLLPAFVAYMNQFQIRPEERALQAKFGARFSHYMAGVRRWL